MKANLSAGNITGAIGNIHSSTKGIYEDTFTILPDKLLQITQDMQDIEIICAKDGAAKFRIKRDELIQGQVYTITYDIYFGVDEDGIWRIIRF